MQGRQNRRPSVRPTTSCAPRIARSHHHPMATASAESTPMVAWLNRGARESITSRSRYGSTSRFTSESITDVSRSATLEHVLLARGMSGRSGLLATFREEQASRGFRARSRRRWLVGFVIVAAIAVAIVLIVLYTGGGGSSGGGGY